MGFLRDLPVNCVSCHGDRHSSASDVAKVKIPTPETCAQWPRSASHAIQEREECRRLGGDEGHAPIHWQPMAMTQGEKGCGGCHKIGDRSLAEIVELRQNGAGTEFGAARCDAWHTRHTPCGTAGAKCSAT